MMENESDIITVMFYPSETREGNPPISISGRAARARANLFGSEEITVVSSIDNDVVDATGET